METSMKNSLLTLFFTLLLNALSFAQAGNEEYISMATSELDSSCQSGLINEYVLESGTKGAYTFEITIKGKGQIVSMNIKERSEHGTIAYQNSLKDFVMKKVKLSFKIPKERYYKFEYTFSFK
jgi:hypothetical protein